MNKGYSTFQVAKALGEKYQRLRGWLDTGAIIPSIQRADGIGGRSKFNQIDVYCISLFKEMLSLGFSRDEAGARVRVVHSYLSGTKTKFGDPDFVEHILIAKHGDTFLSGAEVQGHEPKWYKSIGDLLAAAAKEPLRIILLSQQMFDELPLSKLLTYKGRHSADGPNTYTAMVIINFGHIVRTIDRALE
jgi:hypothetical protein